MVRSIRTTPGLQGDVANSSDFPGLLGKKWASGNNWGSATVGRRGQASTRGTREKPAHQS